MSFGHDIGPFRLDFRRFSTILGRFASVSIDFWSGDRLQRLLRAVLFEPRAYKEQAASCSRVPARVRLSEDDDLEPFGTRHL